jgi:hypothetical protein
MVVSVTQWDGTIVRLNSVITGDNGVYLMPINVSNARELAARFPGSGAIASIAYHMCNGENDPNSAVHVRKLQDDKAGEDVKEEATVSDVQPIESAPDGASYCQSQQHPCEGGNGMVHVCHYSARRGYQTFCIPEADSEILRFYSQDYCGPCVGGYANIDG